MSKLKDVKELSKDKSEKVQEKYLAKFLKEKSLPVVVGQPDGLNKKSYHKKFLIHLGFFGFEIIGGFFRFLKMPKGWKKVVAKQSPQWCYFVDDKKRNRAAIFYKVLAVSNRGALRVNTFVNYMTRFIIRTATNDGMISSCVFDTTNVIYESEKFADVKDKKEKDAIEKKCYLECELWLKDNYPEWKNISAYWD